MIKRLFNYLFDSFLNEFRSEVRAEFAASHAVLENALSKAFVDLTSEQIAMIRRDMVLEMNRVGLALMATNRQIVTLNHSMTIVRATHNQILEVARKLTYEPPIPEKRMPGQVDWVPSPDHFGNKIDFTT